MLDLLIFNPWLVALIWAGMYVFDYSSTLWLARAYESTLSRYVSYERGVELNPNLEAAIAARRFPGLMTFFVLVLVFLMLLLSPLVGRVSFWLGHLLTEFICGALLLTWSFINSRHLRNYAYVWFLRRKPDALQGKQAYSYWYMQKTLSADAAAFSLLLLFIALLTWRIFFLAGALACLSVALRAYRLANRKFKPQAGAEAAS